MRLRRRKGVDKLPLDRRTRKIPLAFTGVVVLVLIVGLAVAGSKRHAIQADLTSGHTYQAQFDRNYLMQPDQTKVKVSGVPVGVVTAVKPDKQGALVSVKVFGNDNKMLGTAPSAQMRILTLLGGINYVQLTPGGGPGSPQGVIPLSRTTTPVYIDSILSTMPPPAQQGTKKFVNQFSTTLTNGGTKSATDLLTKAPVALNPATTVLNAFQGNQPDDLTDLVNNVENTDATLLHQQGQIESVVTGLGTFSSTLGNQSEALGQTAATLQTDLTNARGGLTALSSVLNEVNITANVARPTIQQLDTLVKQSQPTLVDALPVLRALQPFLTNTAPLLNQLVPTSTQTTSILNQVHGPVLDRLLKPTAEGPAIIPSLVNARSVPGDELGIQGATVKPFTLYQAIAYGLTGVAGTFGYYDNTYHYVPVVTGLNQYSAVPSALADPSTDTCAGLVCPGGDPSGNAASGNAALPKSVTPPGVQP